MNWKNVRRVLSKELRETVRDRRTMVIMVVVPILLYPMLLVIIEQMALFGQRQIEGEPARIAVVGADPAVRDFLEADSGLFVLSAESIETAKLRSGEWDAVVGFEPAAEGGSGGSARVEVLFDASRERSQKAHREVTTRLDEWGDILLSERLAQASLPETFATPLVVADSSVASAQSMGSYALGRFLPMLLILITLLGAFYPAIDLTAGEKERGTLETLLTSPVAAKEAVTGKFLAVMCMAVGAGALNLLSMLLTFESGIFQMARSAGIEFELPLRTVFVLLLFLIPLAVFFSALFIGVAVRAHSFKEGQNLLTPIQILAFIPVYLPLIPGIEFTYTLALVPIGGVAILFRELLMGTAPLGPSLVALGATAYYAYLALRFAARSFGREEVLFGSGGDERVSKEGLLDRLKRWQKPEKEVVLPRPGAAVLFVIAVALLHFYIAARFQVWGVEQGLLAAQWLLLGIPALFFAWAGPYKVRETLALRAPSGRALAAGVLIMLGGIPISWMLGWVQSFFLEIPEEFLQGFTELLSVDSMGRYVWLLFLIALTPAICEELVFRGVLLQGLSSEWRMRRAVVVSALVFGAFHLSFESAIRFLPTAWLGLLLAYVAWNTRSIFVGMLMHFINNATVITLLAAEDYQAYVIGPEGTPRWIILLIGLFCLAGGLYLLPKREEERGRSGALHETDTREDASSPLSADLQFSK